MACRWPPDLFRAEAPRQAVTVLVNGWRADSVALDDGFQTYVVDVPANTVRAGRNLIEFQYRFSPRGDDLLAVAAADRVDRVVAWQMIEFDHVVSLDTPRVTEATDTAEGLLLPFNTGMEYFARASDAWLRLGALRAWGESAPGVRLEISVATDQDPEAAHFEIAPSRWGQPGAVRLPESASDQPVRVSFVARFDGQGPIAGGLTLDHPALVMARRPDTTPDARAVGDDPDGASAARARHPTC